MYLYRKLLVEVDLVRVAGVLDHGFRCIRPPPSALRVRGSSGQCGHQKAENIGKTHTRRQLLFFLKVPCRNRNGGLGTTTFGDQ